LPHTRCRWTKASFGQGVEKKKKVKSKLSFDVLLAKYKRDIRRKEAN
jgi:hypothetical protein